MEACQVTNCATGVSHALVGLQGFQVWAITIKIGYVKLACH